MLAASGRSVEVELLSGTHATGALHDPLRGTVGFDTEKREAPRVWQLAANGVREQLPVHFVLDGDVVGPVVDGHLLR